MRKVIFSDSEIAEVSNLAFDKGKNKFMLGYITMITNCAECFSQRRNMRFMFGKYNQPAKSQVASRLFIYSKPTFQCQGGLTMLVQFCSMVT